jgi:hypothetical protein
VPAETHRAPTGPARPAWPVKCEFLFQPFHSSEARSC